MITFSGGRIFSLLLMCLLVLIPTSAFAAPGSPGATYEQAEELDHKSEGFPPADSPSVGCLWFTETAGQRGGFSVCDDHGAQFRTAFERYGLANVGYPVSTRFMRDGFVTQAFQKAIFQWREESQEVAFVNVFDELHNLGFDERLFETRQTPKPLPADWDGQLSFEQVVQKRQALLSRPALREAYFAVSDPMSFFGLPTSEVQDMGDLYAIRLQRAVLQEWKVDVPWAKAGQVTVANGGDIAKELGHIPPESAQPEARPPRRVDMPPQEPEAPALLEEARATYEAGEYAEAIPLFEAFLEQEKEGDWALEARSTLAVSQCNVGEYEAAIDGALEVLAIFPNSAWGDDAHATIVVSFYHQNEYAQSLHAWIQLRRHYPESDWADEDALPDLWRTYCTPLVENQSGIFFGSSGQEGVVEQLEQHFATLTADSDAEPLAQFKQGMALYKSEQYVEAASLWQALIDQNPLDKWSVAARYLMADIFYQLNGVIGKGECDAILIIGGGEEALRELEELATCYREEGYLVGEANTLQNLATVFYHVGNNEQALLTYQRALELQEAIGNTIRAGNILHDLGLVYEREGQYSQAQTSYQQAIETLNKTPNVWRTEAQIGIAYTLNKMGALQEAQGRYDEALTSYQQSQAIWRELNYESDIAALWLNIGAVYQAQGNHIDALNAYQQALGQQAEGRPQPEVQNALGLGYHALGRYEEAISAYQSALEREEQAKLFNHLGLTYHKLGRYQEALASYQQALELSERKDDVFGQSLAYHNIGLVHHTRGDYSKALDNYQQALDLWHTTSGRDVGLSSILQVPLFTGLVYGNYGRHAFATLSAEGPLNTRVLSIVSAGEANTLTTLAALHVAQGDLTKAKATYEQALHIQQESGDQIGVALTQQAIAELP